jgi:hypothetical protein
VSEWLLYYAHYVWWYVTVQFPTFDWATRLRIIGFWVLPIVVIYWGWRRGRARVRGERP